MDFFETTTKQLRKNIAIYLREISWLSCCSQLIQTLAQGVYSKLLLSIAATPSSSVSIGLNKSDSDVCQVHQPLGEADSECVSLFVLSIS